MPDAVATVLWAVYWRIKERRPTAGGQIQAGHVVATALCRRVERDPYAEMPRHSEAAT